MATLQTPRPKRETINDESIFYKYTDSGGITRISEFGEWHDLLVYSPTPIDDAPYKWADGEEFEKHVKYTKKSFDKVQDLGGIYEWRVRTESKSFVFYLGRSDAKTQTMRARILAERRGNQGGQVHEKFLKEAFSYAMLPRLVDMPPERLPLATVQVQVRVMYRVDQFSQDKTNQHEFLVGIPQVVAAERWLLEQYDYACNNQINAITRFRDFRIWLYSPDVVFAALRALIKQARKDTTLQDLLSSYKSKTPEETADEGIDRLKIIAQLRRRKRELAEAHLFPDLERLFSDLEIK